MPRRSSRQKETEWNSQGPGCFAGNCFPLILLEVRLSMMSFQPLLKVLEGFACHKPSKGYIFCQETDCVPVVCPFSFLGRESRLPNFQNKQSSLPAPHHRVRIVFFSEWIAFKFLTNRASASVILSCSSVYGRHLTESAET